MNQETKISEQRKAQHQTASLTTRRKSKVKQLLQKRHLTKSNRLVIKTLNTLGKEGTFLNTIKGIQRKPTANTLSGEKLKAFPCIRRNTRVPLSPLLFNTALEVPALEVPEQRGKKKDIKSIPVGKEEVKLSLRIFKEMCSTQKTPQNPPRTTKANKKFRKVESARSIHKDQVYFYILAMNNPNKN